jgi:hypothetical protein
MGFARIEEENKIKKEQYVHRYALPLRNGRI